MIFFFPSFYSSPPNNGEFFFLFFSLKENVPLLPTSGFFCWADSGEKSANHVEKKRFNCWRQFNCWSFYRKMTIIRERDIVKKEYFLHAYEDFRPTLIRFAYEIDFNWQSFMDRAWNPRIVVYEKRKKKNEPLQWYRYFLSAQSSTKCGTITFWLKWCSLFFLFCRRPTGGEFV